MCSPASALQRKAKNFEIRIEGNYGMASLKRRQPLRDLLIGTDRNWTEHTGSAVRDMNMDAG
jgi:hypothetical protein